MTSMRSIATMTLGGISLVLLLYIILFERHAPTTAEALAASRLLAPIPAEEVVSIRIKKQAGKETILTRVDAGEELNWRLEAPVEDQVNPEVMREFLDELEHLTIRESIHASELGKGMADAAELGFADAEVIEVQIRFQDGRRPRTLLVGAEAPFKDTLYIQTTEDRARKGVYLVDASFRDMLVDPMQGFRDHRIVRVHATRVISYSMRTETGVMELERELKAPVWFLKRPLQTRANDEIAYSIMDELCQLQAESFKDSDVQPISSRWSGGDVGPRTAVFRLKTDLGEEFEFLLEEGQPNAQGRVMTQVSVSNRDTLFQVDTDLVSRLPNSVNQLRYPYLATLNPETLGLIVIRSRENPMVELRSDAQRNWFLNWLGTMQPADEGRIEKLLAAIKEEPILEYRSDTASRLEQYGLDRPHVSVSFSSASVDGDLLDAYNEAVAEAEAKGEPTDKIQRPDPVVTTQTYRFGFDDGVLLNANVEGEPFIYGIDPAFLPDNVPTHPLKWRGLQLIDLDFRWFRKIEVLQLGQPPLSIDYDWMRNEWDASIGDTSIEGRLDRVKARRLVDHLAQLEAVEWLTSRLEANEALQRPSAVVKLQLVKPSMPGEDEAEPVPLVITFAPAAMAEDRVLFYFGRIGQQPDAFVLDAESYRKIVEPVVK